jgi:hypothetical protein
MNFNDFYWHDAIIKNVSIDRNRPGVLDEIIFDIEWSEDKGKVTLVFESVYLVKMNLNFGIVADETILNAIVLDENNEDLANFYSKWKGAMNEVKLNTYKIDLNSTGSEIKIIAKGFRVEDIWKIAPASPRNR